MVIRILDIVEGCDTSDQGDVVNAAVEQAFLQEGGATVSFAGVGVATSSFVNAAFVELLDKYSLDELKALLRFVDSTKQINEMIRLRLTSEAKRAA